MFTGKYPFENCENFTEIISGNAEWDWGDCKIQTYEEGWEKNDKLNGEISRREFLKLLTQFPEDTPPHIISIFKDCVRGQKKLRTNFKDVYI